MWILFFIWEVSILIFGGYYIIYLGFMKRKTFIRSGGPKLISEKDAPVSFWISILTWILLFLIFIISPILRMSLEFI